MKVVGCMFVETADRSLTGKNPPVPGQQQFPGHATAVCSHLVIKASFWAFGSFPTESCGSFGEASESQSVTSNKNTMSPQMCCKTVNSNRGRVYSKNQSMKRGVMRRNKNKEGEGYGQGQWSVCCASGQMPTGKQSILGLSDRVRRSEYIYLFYIYI